MIHKDYIAYRGDHWWERWQELTGKSVPDELRVNKHKSRNTGHPFYGNRSARRKTKGKI